MRGGLHAVALLPVTSQPCCSHLSGSCLDVFSRGRRGPQRAGRKSVVLCGRGGGMGAVLSSGDAHASCSCVSSSGQMVVTGQLLCMHTVEADHWRLTHRLPCTRHPTPHTAPFQ